MPAKKIPTRSTGIEKDIKINRAEALVCEKKFGLSVDYQIEIRKKYKDYKSLLQLTKDVYQDQALDENSDEFKNVKNFVTRVHTKQEVYDFREEQITFIAENGESMRPMDITRVLFHDVDGNPLKECRSVVAVLSALGVTYGGETESKEHLGPYVPPSSDHKVIALINRADSDANYHIAKLDSEKRKRIALIKKHLSSPRIVAMISSIRSKMHRDVFETQFVLYLIDKEAPVAEDIATIANLANENVRSLLITDEIAILNDRLAEASSEDEDSRKFTKNLSDSLGNKAAEYNSCQTRMIKLHADLAGSRSERLKYMGIVNESLAKYIELAKTEEGRSYFIRLARKRENKLYDEAKRIESLSDLVAQIKGVSVSEILKFNV